MSWEEMYTLSAACPCGKSRITQKVYGDDWNRYEDGPVVIECVDCAKKFKIETITHYGRLSSDRYWNTYYLTPIDYPDYSGIKETEIYPPKANPYNDMTNWLIENYTMEELSSVLSQLNNTTSSAKLTGIAASIREMHRKAKKTVRLRMIIQTVESALKCYPDYVGNKRQRDVVRKREEKERDEYTLEKRKFQKVITLER